MAQEKAIRGLTEECSKDIQTYCKAVTPGDGRLLACLYAFNDKLSSRCEFALYDASVRLERAVNALSYVAHECRQALNTYCSAVKPGEGRLFDCVEKKPRSVTVAAKPSKTWG